MTDALEPYDELDAAERGLNAPAAGDEKYTDDDGEAEAEFSSVRQSRRRPTRSKRDKGATIKSILSGGRDLALQDDDDEIYDEVTEEEYERRRRSLQENNFIEADNGDYNGYEEHGGEIWDDDEGWGEGGTSNAAKRAKRGLGAKKGKRREKKVVKRRVNKMFTSGGKASRLGSAVVGLDNEETVDGNDSFLAEVLAAEGNESADEEEDASMMRKLKKGSNLLQTTLFGSNVDAREVYLSGPKGKSNQIISPDWHKSSRAGSPASKKRRGPIRVPQPSLDVEDHSDMPPDNDHMETDVQVDIEPMNDDMDVASPQKSNKRTLELDDGVKKEQVRPKVPKMRVLAMPTEEDLEEDLEARPYLRAAEVPKETTEDWQRVRAKATPVDAQPVAKVNVDTSKLPLVEEEGEEVMKMYWLDMYQGEGSKSGTVYMFGKVWVEEANQFLSCCVAVKNVERNLFFLPREYHIDDDGDQTDEKVTPVQVYQEVDELLSKHGVKKHFCKNVTRNYAFEHQDVPVEATYLKVKYSGNLPQLPSSLSGKTFSRVFGTNVGPLERFIMKRNLMGPSWITIKKARPASTRVSWCKIEAELDDPKMVSVPEQQPASPPLTVLSLSLQTHLNRRTHANELLVISGLVHNGVNLDGPTADPEKDYSHFTAIRKLGDTPFPFDFQSTVHQTKGKSLEVVGSERALLAYFMAKVFKIDPDVIIGHNLLGFGLDVLMHRMKANNTPYWSRIGRLRRTQFPKMHAGGLGGRASYATRTAASGRLLCDLQISSREFLRMVSYGLSELAKEQLNTMRVDLDPESIPSKYSQTKNLLELTEHVERDAFLIMSLMFKIDVLPLSKQITCITGGLLASTFAAGRAKRNEYLLCHEFHRRKYITPDVPAFKKKEKDDKGKTKGRKKPAYEGGLVLEPKKGFYDKYILLLDFNSLYPSIIQEFNICFTTVTRNPEEPDLPADVPDPSLETGILPKVLKNLIAKRKIVKNLIKQESDPVKLTEYDVRQKALKLTANSMYGCLGFGASRFYAKPLAALITSKGREILQKTVDLAQDMLRLDVIYGDTDSIMINTRCTNLTDVKAIGNKVKKEVNALYRLLEIEIDGVFKTMLLLKKKKYAALAIVEKNGKTTTVRETKGLDMVRRDWCALSHTVGYYILNQILTQESREQLVEVCHEHLRQVAEDLKTPGKVALEQFIINKSLTKDPEEYADATSQPHVQVALKMRKAGKSARALDTIPYVICVDGTSNSATQRAYHPEEVRKQIKEVDIDYYLQNQIHPVVSRLLEPIDGTDNAQIADCLGLDATQFRRQYASRDIDTDFGFQLSSQLSDKEKYKTAEKLKLKCSRCNQDSEFQGVFREASGTLRCGLLCPNPQCNGTFSAVYLKNKLTLAIRSYIDKFYAGYLVCDEPSCPRASKETRALSVKGRDCLDPHCRGQLHMVYSHTLLYTQIKYFRYLFDAKHALKELAEDQVTEGESILVGHRDAFHSVYQHVQTFMDKSDYSNVRLANLLSCLSF